MERRHKATKELSNVVKRKSYRKRAEVAHSLPWLVILGNAAKRSYCLNRCIGLVLPDKKQNAIKKAKNQSKKLTVWIDAYGRSKLPRVSFVSKDPDLHPIRGRSVKERS